MKSSITLSVFLLLALAACGKLDSSSPVDAEFRQEVDYFLQAAAVRGHGDLSKAVPPIGFGSLPDGITGRCEWDLLAGRRVIVSASRWSWSTEWEKKALILHELGHCVLSRDHTEGMDSVMYHSSLVVADMLKESESTYLDELFEGK